MIINNLIGKHTKSYKTVEGLIKAVEKKLGPASGNQYDLIIVEKENGFRPIIKWRDVFQYRVGDSVNAGFYTIN